MLLSGMTLSIVAIRSVRMTFHRHTRVLTLTGLTAVLIHHIAIPACLTSRQEALALSHFSTRSNQALQRLCKTIHSCGTGVRHTRISGFFAHTSVTRVLILDITVQAGTTSVSAAFALSNVVARSSETSYFLTTTIHSSGTSVGLTRVHTLTHITTVEILPETTSTP